MSISMTKCPFVTRVPSCYLQKAGKSLYFYGERCPIVSRMLHTAQGPRSVTVPNRSGLERLYLSIHSGLPRATTNTFTQCPFRGILPKTFSSSATQHDQGPPATPPQGKEGIMPKGNCPFRWSDFIADSIKDKAKQIMTTVPATPPATTSPPAPKPAYTMPLTDDGKPDYEQFFEDKIQDKLNDKSYRRFRVLTRNADHFPTAKHFSSPSASLDEGKDITVWCSNDYMGMSKHPEVIKATIDTIKNHGVGAGGTRNISGTSYYHCLLEKEVASLHQKEAGLIFSSCYVANDATFATLGKMLPNCVYFSDSDNHASMIEGMKHSGAKKEIFRHNDVAHLEELLQKYDPVRPKIVTFESVYSMTGKIGHIKDICEVAKRYNALTFIDEVHAVGLYGEEGAGVAQRDGLMDQCDIISGTLGKAFGVSGGYIAGSAKMVDMVRSYASGFIFTTAIPPMQAAAATRSIQILRGKEGRDLRSRHQASVKQLRAALEAANLPVEQSPSHIVPLHVGNAELCTKASMMLMEKHGIYVQDINYPTVPRGQEKLRIAPTPHHNDNMKMELVAAIVDVWEELELSFVQRAVPQPACSRLVLDVPAEPVPIAVY